MHILGILAIFVLPIVIPPPGKHGSKTNRSTTPVSTATAATENTVSEDILSTSHKKIERLIVMSNVQVLWTLQLRKSWY